jgi:hypothetical protein
VPAFHFGALVLLLYLEGEELVWVSEGWREELTFLDGLSFVGFSLRLRWVYGFFFVFGHFEAYRPRETLTT